jgi:hypothetical protein
MKLPALLAVLITLAPLYLWAGEKEEIQLKQLYLQEKAARIQAEYALTQYQAKELEEQKRALNKKPEVKK